jgi:hypothetical protein
MGGVWAANTAQRCGTLLTALLLRDLDEALAAALNKEGESGRGGGGGGGGDWGPGGEVGTGGSMPRGQAFEAARGLMERCRRFVSDGGLSGHTQQASLDYRAGAGCTPACK